VLLAVPIKTLLPLFETVHPVFIFGPQSVTVAHIEAMVKSPL